MLDPQAHSGEAEACRAKLISSLAKRGLNARDIVESISDRLGSTIPERSAAKDVQARLRSMQDAIWSEQRPAIHGPRAA